MVQACQERTLFFEALAITGWESKWGKESMWGIFQLMAHLLKSQHAENDSAMTHSALKVAKKWPLRQPFGSIMPHRYSVVFKSLSEALPTFKKKSIKAQLTPPPPLGYVTRQFPTYPLNGGGGKRGSIYFRWSFSLLINCHPKFRSGSSIPFKFSWCSPCLAVRSSTTVSPFIVFAKRVLAVSANSASCEQLFSIFGNILTKVRNRTGDTVLVKLSEVKLHIRDDHVASGTKMRYKRNFSAKPTTTSQAQSAPSSASVDSIINGKCIHLSCLITVLKFFD